MTTKQNIGTKGAKSTSTSKSKSRRALIARAEAIRNDADYDYDTRKEIAAALEDESLNDYKLAKMVEQAEAGEYVEHPFNDSFEQDYRSTAHRTVQFLESELPDWLIQAACMAIDDAARLFNIQVMPADGDGNYSARALADLFRVSEATQFDDIYSTDLDLAEHLSVVLNHPDLPIRIHNKLSEAIGEIAVSDAVLHRAEVLRIALEAKGEQKGGEG